MVMQHMYGEDIKNYTTKEQFQKHYIMLEEIKSYTAQNYAKGDQAVKKLSQLAAETRYLKQCYQEFKAKK